MPATQFELFPLSVDLHRVDPDRKMRRFYSLGLQLDLFGGVSVVREWGRIGSGGRVRYDRFASEGQAVGALSVLLQKKRRRGYSGVRSTSSP